MSEFVPTNHGFIELDEADKGYSLPGGIVKRFKASGALNIGDAVLLSAADTVTKTTTTTNHKNRMGIVVGGTATGMRVMQGSTLIGLAAAADTQDVLVCISGICYGIADGTTVALGDKLRLGTGTAGRLLDGTDTTDLAAGITGLIVGTALETQGTAGGAVKVLVSLG